jgi:hypothetical protein
MEAAILSVDEIEVLLVSKFLESSSYTTITDQAGLTSRPASALLCWHGVIHVVSYSVKAAIIGER